MAIRSAWWPRAAAQGWILLESSHRASGATFFLRKRTWNDLLLLATVDAADATPDARVALVTSEIAWRLFRAQCWRLHRNRPQLRRILPQRARAFRAEAIREKTPLALGRICLASAPSVFHAAQAAARAGSPPGRRRGAVAYFMERSDRGKTDDYRRRASNFGQHHARTIEPHLCTTHGRCYGGHRLLAVPFRVGPALPPNAIEREHQRIDALKSEIASLRSARVVAGDVETCVSSETVYNETMNAARIARELYGIEAVATRAPNGEFDDNYHLVGPKQYILKIMREGCDRAFVEMQCRAMEHLGLCASCRRDSRTRGSHRLDARNGCRENCWPTLEYHSRKLLRNYGRLAIFHRQKAGNVRSRRCASRTQVGSKARVMDSRTRSFDAGSTADGTHSA